MESTVVELITKYGLFSGVAIWAASFILPRLFKARGEIAETTARTDIIELLNARVARLENEFEDERDKRIEAEDLVDKLMRRIDKLEAQIRALGHEPL